MFLFFFTVLCLSFFEEVLASVLQRNRTNRMLCKYSEAFIIGTGSCDYGGWQAPHLQCGLAGWRPKKANRADKVQRQAVGELPLAQGGWSFWFYSGLQLIGWGPPTLWRVICSKFTNLNVNLTQKHPPSWHLKFTITNI